MAIIELPPKHPISVEPYFIVLCDEDGTNTGAATDNGELQGATISSYNVVAPTGITKASDNKSAVTITGVTYAISTVITFWLSGGTANTDYTFTWSAVLSDARTLAGSVVIPVRA
jgi:hypothetical protein